MVVYSVFITLVLILYSQYCFSKDKIVKYISSNILFLIVLLFLGLRKGIGIDYSHYEHAFQAIKIGEKMYLSEPIYYIFNKVFSLINYESMIFFVAFLSVYYFSISLNTNNRILYIPLAIFLLYIPSFTLMRQVLAIVHVIYGFSVDDDKHRFKWLIIASLIHKSMWILTILYFICKYVKISWHFVLIFCFVFMIIFTFSNMGLGLLEIILKYTPYAYYLNTIHLLTKRHVGILTILQLGYELSFFIYNKSSLKNRNNSFVNLLFMFMICSEIVGLRILIFATRVTFIFYPAFFIEVQKKQKRYKLFEYSGLFLAFLVAIGKLINTGHWDNVVPYSSLLF